MPSVSVLSTCKKPEDATALKEALERQTFKDFELILAHDATIPDGWNSAINKAKGDTLVFIETDSVPAEDWLSNLVNEVRENTLVRGLEVVPTALHMNNLAMTRNTLNDLRLDRDFRPADDTEFFIRLFDRGVSLKETCSAMAFHYRKVGVRRRLGRSFLYGEKWSRIYHQYGALYDSWYHAVGNSVLTIVGDVLLLLGTIYGLVRYLPNRFLRRAGTRSPRFAERYLFTERVATST
jgi:glycosyltransferase involved in cell wall biosynthesis